MAVSGAESFIEAIKSAVQGIARLPQCHGAEVHDITNLARDGLGVCNDESRRRRQCGWKVPCWKRADKVNYKTIGVLRRVL